MKKKFYTYTKWVLVDRHIIVMSHINIIFFYKCTKKIMNKIIMNI